MRTICYYISDYGYGHATRSIAIIRALMVQDPHRYRIIVCSGKTIGFIQRSLLESAGFGDISFRECASDLGYILKQGSVEPDLEMFKFKYVDYIKTMPLEIQREADFILKEKVDLIVTDISPVPIGAAKLAKIQSIAISNFTWYTAYMGFIERGYLQPLFDVYSHIDYFIHLSGSAEPHWGRGSLMKSGFFCRAPVKEETNRLTNLLKPHSHSKIVYVALGMSIQADHLDKFKMWKEDSCLFVVSSNLNIKGKNIHHIPSNYTESQNYVAAADIIVSKPGWGTVAEGVILNKPLILLNRSLMNEDKNTLEEINCRHSYKLAMWEELQELDLKAVFKVMNPKPQQEIANDINIKKIIRYLENIANA